MLSTAQKRTMATAADLLALPEDERFHEIIGGEIVRKAMPSARHGGAQTRVIRVVSPYDHRPRPPRPGGWWFAAEVEIELESIEVYRPDVAGWLRVRMPELPEKAPIAMRPDWVCEVLSPSNKSNDTIRKRRVYHRCEVPHYWIIDPVEETLDVFRWHTDGYLQVLKAGRGDRVRTEPFDAVDLHVGVLFGDDEEDRD